MAEYQVKEIKNKEIWEKFVSTQKPKSFLQSWNWGETHRQMGDKIFRLGFFKDKRLIGVCLIIKEEARRGPHFLIPGGPLINWNEEKLVSLFIRTLRELARREKIWFARVRPELLDTKENRDFFSGLGFISAPMHLHAENTWVLDIRPKDEVLLSGMRKSTRYLVRKSLEANLSFEQTVDSKATKILGKLQEETVARHKFVGFSTKLFRAQLETFSKDNQASLFIGRKGKTPLVAAIIIFYGDYAYYHHSGSSSRFRKIPFSYFLQWEIIKEAKKRGCKYYNFWGIAPSDDPRHRFAGVTLFKKGFGGKRVDWLHAHDFPISHLYWPTYVFETGRRSLRRL